MAIVKKKKKISLVCMTHSASHSPCLPGERMRETRMDATAAGEVRELLQYSNGLGRRCSGRNGVAPGYMDTHRDAWQPVQKAGKGLAKEETRHRFVFSTGKAAVKRDPTSAEPPGGCGPDALFTWAAKKHGLLRLPSHNSAVHIYLSGTL